MPLLFLSAVSLLGVLCCEASALRPQPSPHAHPNALHYQQLMAKLEGKSAVVSERLHPGLMDAWEEKKTELLKQRQQLQMKVAQEAMVPLAPPHPSPSRPWAVSLPLPPSDPSMHPICGPAEVKATMLMVLSLTFGLFAAPRLEIAHQKIKSASSKTKAMIKAKSDLNAEAELRRKLDSRKLRKECAEQQRKQSILEFRERLANASPKTKSIPTGKDLREKIQSQAEYAQKKAAGLREKQSREVQAELRRRWLKKQFMERRRAAAEAKEPTPSFIHK